MRMQNVARSPIFSYLFFALIGMAYIAYRLVLASPQTIPAEFSEARAEGAIISQVIVGTSNEISRELEVVEKLESEEKYAEAISLVAPLIEKSNSIRVQAERLSNELIKMTNTLSEIDSQSAREVAVESITYRLELISNLITYSNDMTQLLTTLQERLGGRRDHEVGPSELVARINETASRINELDGLASSAMRRFDEIMR